MGCCGRPYASTWQRNKSVRAARGQRRRPESAFRIPVSVGVFGRLHSAPQNGCTPAPCRPRTSEARRSKNTRVLPPVPPSRTSPTDAHQQPPGPLTVPSLADVGIQIGQRRRRSAQQPLHAQIDQPSGVGNTLARLLGHRNRRGLGQIPEMHPRRRSSAPR
jgi:hypothetical protein